MVQIDNTKMWATILYYLEDYTGSTVSLSSIIKQALKDQGLDYQDGKIVETKQQSVDEAMADIEEKAKLFTEAHQGENADDILRQMQGEESIGWSEEDEKIISRLHDIIFDCKTFGKFRVTEEEYSKLYDWLKSLIQKLSNVERNGKNWKPTEEQMRVLALSFGGVYKEEDIQILRGLFEQLKAL